MTLIPGLRPPNTPEGRALGRELGRLCDGALAGKRDERYATCALCQGDDIAKGSPETLISAIKCAMKVTVLRRHEHDHPCARRAAMRFGKAEHIQAPWDHPADADLDVTPEACHA